MEMPLGARTAEPTSLVSYQQQRYMLVVWYYRNSLQNSAANRRVTGVLGVVMAAFGGMLMPS